jgi:hypothetical protein
MTSVRGAAIVLVCLAGAFIAGNFRTQCFGISLGCCLISSLFIGPMTALPFVGLQWREGLIGTAALLIAVLTSVEAMAVWEEYLFQRECAADRRPQDHSPIFRPRAWPYQGHSMRFDPRTGAFDAAD